MTDIPATRDITIEIEIDAPQAAAWRALTTPEELARWFPPISSGSGDVVGEKLLISWGEQMEWWTTIAAVDPGQHVRWLDDPAEYAKFAAGESDKPVLATDWYVEARGGRTIVRIVNSGFDASSTWDDRYNAIGAGWRYFLFNLKHYLERHAGTPRTLVWERRKSPVSRDALWSRLMGADGFALGESSITLGGNTHAATVDLMNAPTHLWVRIPSLNDALLFVESELGKKESFRCGLWLSTYGLPEAQVYGLREHLRALADRAFAPAAPASS
jgi:uncharacterized protein YndB with AHSA1/START domain